MQRTEDRQNLGFEGVFRDAHYAPAPKTRGPAKWFQWSCGIAVRAIVAEIPAAVRGRWNHFADRGVLATNRHGDTARREEADVTGASVPTVVDAAELERKVRDMYTRVALDPHGKQ
jgi:hypothetical protein